MLSAVPTRRELLAWALAILLATALVASFAVDALAGAGPPPAPSTYTVYIATGENFPDALGAAAAAGTDLAPVLLVQQNSVPQATIDELERLEPREIIIVGGEAVVSAGVANTLDNDLSFNPHVVRLSGNNRYETAANLSAATFPTSGRYPRVAFVRGFALGGQTPGVIDLLDTTITAPHNGYLWITGGADFSYAAAPAIVGCWITVDTDEISGSRRFSDLDSTSTEDNCTTNVVVPVGAGEIGVAFRTSTDATVNVEVGSLSVLWIPFGHVGQTPFP